MHEIPSLRVASLCHVQDKLPFSLLCSFITVLESGTVRILFDVEHLMIRPALLIPSADISQDQLRRLSSQILDSLLACSQDTNPMTDPSSASLFFCSIDTTTLFITMLQQ